MEPPAKGDSERFSRVWEADAPRVLLYARRHVGFDDAQDVVADTFTAAWRRWDDVPDPALPWLIGTARNCIKNIRRAGRRRDALTDRINLLEAVAADDPVESATRRHEALMQLAALSEQQREALLLISWDGLSIDQAATVLGLRPGTFRVRLHRAREALQSTTESLTTRTAQEIS